MSAANEASASNDGLDGVQPNLYVSFSESGNIRYWTPDREQAIRLSNETGAGFFPYYRGEIGQMSSEAKYWRAFGLHAEQERERLIVDCLPFMKDGETPAECIERNRRDVDVALSLLVNEKRKTEELESEIQKARSETKEWAEKWRQSRKQLAEIMYPEGTGKVSMENGGSVCSSSND